MTLAEIVTAEIVSGGPITGLDFGYRLRGTGRLNLWQRFVVRVTSPYVILARLEEAGLVAGYLAPRPGVPPPYNWKLMYRLRESGSSTTEKPPPLSDGER